MVAPSPQPELGRLVRRLRREQDITQETLGSAADVGAKYLGDIERGICNPSIAVVLKLARGLGMRLQELMAQLEMELEADGGG
jgi:transcriptional regulator with XRE-family HTH domain